MARPIVPEPPPLHASTRTAPLKFSIDVVTPMFGGGYEAGECDTDMPVRATSVRGHLRFWWRALYGARYATPDEMRTAENAHWGDTTRKGRVWVDVDVKKRGEPYWPHDVSQGSAISYALFPYRPQEGRQPKPERHGLTGVKFDLILTGPDCQSPEILGAVQAWVRYGGVGSRTRRGLGSLACGAKFSHTPPPAAPAVLQYPVLAGSTCLLQTGLSPKDTDPRDAVANWQNAIEVYQRFRQNRPSHKDRSRWPEPDTIRWLTGQYGPHHNEPVTALEGFPRADLGLPIIFSFAGNRKNWRDVDKDPAATTLAPSASGEGRFASPVITKPLDMGDGTFRPMILILNSPRVWSRDIVLEGLADVTDTKTSRNRDHTHLTYANKDMRAMLAKAATDAGWKVVSQP